jgi:hypothetical protein
VTRECGGLFRTEVAWLVTRESRLNWRFAPGNRDWSLAGTVRRLTVVQRPAAPSRSPMEGLLDEEVGAMSTLLGDMGALLRAVPTASATAEEVAIWYERKARLFERIATEPGATADGCTRAADQARAAREHASRLRHAVTGGHEPTAA